MVIVLVELLFLWSKLLTPCIYWILDILIVRGFLIFSSVFLGKISAWFVDSNELVVGLRDLGWVIWSGPGRGTCFGDLAKVLNVTICILNTAILKILKHLLLICLNITITRWGILRENFVVFLIILKIRDHLILGTIILINLLRHLLLKMLKWILILQLLWLFSIAITGRLVIISSWA